MTAIEIQNYMIRNGGCPTEIFCDHGDAIVYFDVRYVPVKSYAAMPVVMIDKFHASIAQP